VIDAASDEALAAVGRYADELGARFPTGFDPGDLADEAPAMNAPDGRFLVGLVDGEVAACGGVRRLTRRRAEIKRMWVDEAWRGCGLGARMLVALEDAAYDLGYREVHLDTNATLVEAIAMYERAGYRHIERYNDNPYAQAWFAKRLSRRR
jgi:GNAT superfamily N-acetyltransferase